MTEKLNQAIDGAEALFKANLTFEGGPAIADRAYSYDAFNRMSSVNLTTGGATVGSYQSNALNQRVQKATGSGVTRFVYGPGGELLFETGATPTAYVWLDGQLLGVNRGGAFYASHH